MNPRSGEKADASAALTRVLGIDFSGNHLMWRARRRASNVWIAEITFPQGQPTLSDLRPVQRLPGSAPPFDRLVAYLGSGNFDAAGIDAPFSVPDAYVPQGGHGNLLLHVAGLPIIASRAFPEGTAFAQSLIHRTTFPFSVPKPLRATEQLWASQGLAVRSTLWAGPRPGASMTAACLTLLHRAGAPIWPWNAATTSGLMVEVFPMAQLFRWNLPFTGYNGTGLPRRRARTHIIGGLQRYVVTTGFNAVLQTNADALDAVVAGLAAIAVKRGFLAFTPGPAAAKEGWIAVYT